MPNSDLLEIIYPDGNIHFFNLSLDKGITTIGSHPDNDVVIDGPSVEAFHAVIDHQRKPFRIVFLHEQSIAQTQGQALAANNFQSWIDWQTIDLDGFTITLLEGMQGMPAAIAPGGARVEAAAAPIAAAPSAAPVAAAAALAGTAAAGVAGLDNNVVVEDTPPPEPVSGVTRLPGRPADEPDEAIVVELAEREWTVSVNQVTSCELTIINGGEYVATFDVQVVGIEQEWVNIFPARINLNESSRGVVTVSFVPPELPTTTAGVHHLAFVITSPHYPGHVCRLGASLTINPYYSFTVGSLEPNKFSASWRKPTGMYTMPIQNNGNSTADFELTALDEDNGCAFEFRKDGQAIPGRMAPISVPSGETVVVPVAVRAHKRDLVRLSPRKFQFTVNTLLPAETTAARAVSATFISKPLFGPFSVLLGIIIALALTYIIFIPRLNSFTPNPLVISQGQPVTLAWKGSIFNETYRLRYKYPEDTQFKDLPDEVKPGSNQLSVIPTGTFTTYSLVAGNWLSRLIPIPEVSKVSHAVLAIPAYPEVATFQVDKKDVSLGEAVVVKYAIKNATSGTLTVEDVPVALSAEELSGEKTFKLNKNTMVVLEAKNDSGAIVQSEYIHVWDPKDIQYEFKVEPRTVTSGNPVKVSWKVKGQGFNIDSVIVSPFAEPLPSEYELTYYPTESMYFVVKVKVQDYEKSFPPEYVTVLPADAKPTIDYFKATPPKLANGGNVEFSWSVSGPIDSVVISNKSGKIKENLPAQGYETILVGSSATYILTATKGSQSAAAVVDVVVESLLDVNIQITSILPSSGILRNDKVFIYYSVTPKIASPTAPEVSGSVVITDGFDNCKVELPIASCEFVFHRSGNDKKLVATYSGDANYRRTTSAPFPSSGAISVIGSTVDIANITYLYTSAAATSTLEPLAPDADYPYVGQTGTLQFDLIPNSGSTPVQGGVDVFVDGTTPVCVGEKLKVAQGKDGDQVGRGTCKFTFDSSGVKIFKVRYQGNEIYEPFETDADPGLNEKQKTLKFTVSPAPTKISLVTQTPPNSAQVGQKVTLDLLVAVDAPGGNPVPGKGFLKLIDINNIQYCNVAVSDKGTARCEFVPTRFSSKMTFKFESSATNLYLSSQTDALGYKIAPATASIKVRSVALIPPVTGQTNPIVGQKLGMSYQVLSDGTGGAVKTGTLKVFMKDVTMSQPGAPVCTINLATSNPYCDVLVSYGGALQITTSYEDVAQNYLQNKTATSNYTVNPANVTIQKLTADPPSAVEGASVKVSFDVVPSFETPLKPSGAFRVATNGVGEECTGTYPAVNSCSFSLSGSPMVSRVITVYFGDGRDYVATLAKIDPYKVIHKTITTVTGNTGSPLVNGSTEITYSVVAEEPSLTVTGTVYVHIYKQGVEYASCSGTVAEGKCLMTVLKPGENTVRAEFIPDKNSDFSYSVSDDKFKLIVYKVVTTFSLAEPIVTNSYIDMPVTFNVHATRAQKPSQIPSPNGTAIISARRSSDGATAVCQDVAIIVPTQNDYSQGSCTMRFPGEGSWSLFIEYSGDPYYAAITTPESLNFTHVVSKYPSIVKIDQATPKNNNSRLVDFTFSVVKGSPSYSSAITGSVTLWVKGNPSLTCTAPIVANQQGTGWEGSCPIAFPAAGTYEVFATYNGDTYYETDVSDSAWTVTIP